MSKYLRFPEEPTKMHSAYQSGYPITVGRFYNGAFRSTFLKRFAELTAEFNLKDHNDNLLLLILTLIETYDESIHVAQEEYKFAVRTKELAMLLKALSKRNLGGLLINNDKITDDVILRIAKDALLSAFTPQSLLVSEFQAYPLFFMNSEGELRDENIKNASKAKLQDPSVRLNQLEVKLSGELCLVLLSFLNNETLLKSVPNKKFSDKQLKLLHEILKLLNIWKKSETMGQSPDYKPKGLIRTRLSTYIKELRRQGNKK